MLKSQIFLFRQMVYLFSQYNLNGGKFSSLLFNIFAYEQNYTYKDIDYTVVHSRKSL